MSEYAILDDEAYFEDRHHVKSIAYRMLQQTPGIEEQSQNISDMIFKALQKGYEKGVNDGLLHATSLKTVVKE